MRDLLNLYIKAKSINKQIFDCMNSEVQKSDPWNQHVHIIYKYPLNISQIDLRQIINFSHENGKLYTHISNAEKRKQVLNGKFDKQLANELFNGQIEFKGRFEILEKQDHVLYKKILVNLFRSPIRVADYRYKYLKQVILMIASRYSKEQCWKRGFRQYAQWLLTTQRSTQFLTKEAMKSIKRRYKRQSDIKMKVLAVIFVYKLISALQYIQFILKTNSQEFWVEAEQLYESLLRKRKKKERDIDMAEQPILVFPKEAHE